MKKLITLLLFAIPLLGCDENNSLPENLGFTVLHQGDNLTNGLFYTKQNKVLNSQSLYETELANYNSDIPSAVDFSTNQVLLVDMGKQVSSGYSIDISSLEESNSSITVKIIFTTPSMNCAVDEALTNPYQFVKINSTKLLIFKETQIEMCDS